ncbi:MAG: TetR/AcrR family transcriptional regulator [Rhodococcus sp. (in: high G+C Gram-positive bacteria)]
MARRTNTRQKMLLSAVELLRVRGSAAVTVDAILAHSNAPRGSVYHHFPDGRGEILADALNLAGDAIGTMIEAAAKEGPITALRLFHTFWASTLRDSDFEAGCPVASVGIGGLQEDHSLRSTAGDILARWQDALALAIGHGGVEQADARRMATMIIASVEGAVMMCRMQKSITPLDDVTAELELRLVQLVAPHQ